jgi:hypothetical protein
MNGDIRERFLKSLKLISDAVAIAKRDPDFSGSYLKSRYSAVLDKIQPIVDENREMPEALASEFVDITQHIIRFALTIRRNNWLTYEQKYNLQKPN